MFLTSVPLGTQIQMRPLHGANQCISFFHLCLNIVATVEFKVYIYLWF